MKVIIAGSRNVTDYDVVVKAIKESGFEITAIISGGARGVDALGERYARATGIPLIVMKADWDKYGKSAGYRRNEEMATTAGAVIAIWDGESRGTKHMIDIGKKLGLKVFVHVTR